MYIGDPIADLFARIKNAQEREHAEIVVPASKMLTAIVEILVNRGIVESYNVIEQAPQNQLQIVLKYEEDETPGMSGFKRVSKPGVRIYKNYREINKVRNGMGVGIYSTSKGILDNAQAVASKVGGEYLAEVW